jgi:hypothetical protein
MDKKLAEQESCQILKQRNCYSGESSTPPWIDLIILTVVVGSRSVVVKTLVTLLLVSSTS